MTDPSDFYTGLVVEAYAALKDQTFDPAPYIEFVKAHGQPGLEIGCGVGQPMLQLVSAGLDVDGVDSSVDMIEGARAAAHQQGLDAEFHVCRMEDMVLSRRYRSIYLAGPTFELLPDDESAVRALEAFRRHLASDGTVMIPLWIAGPTPAESLGIAREALDEAGVTLRYTPVSEEFDLRSRTRRTTVRYERIPPAGPRQQVDREWVIHWQTPQTITELASRAGLSVRNLEPSSRHLSGEPDEEFTAFLTHP